MKKFFMLSVLVVGMAFFLAPTSAKAGGCGYGWGGGYYQPYYGGGHWRGRSVYRSNYGYRGGYNRGFNRGFNRSNFYVGGRGWGVRF